MKNSSNNISLIDLKNQKELLTTGMSFFPASVLSALFKLEVFELINEKNVSIQDLCKSADYPSNSLNRVLRVGVALGFILEDDKGKLFLPNFIKATLLSHNKKNYMGNSLISLNYFQTALASLDKAVLLDKPTINPEKHLGQDEVKTNDFILSMDNYANYRAVDLANHLDTRKCKTILDLGCGPGTYAFELAKKNKTLSLFLADKTEVLEIAKKVKSNYQISNSITYIEVDIRKDSIEGKYDLILLSNVLHFIGKMESKKLLNKLYRNLNSGGSIVIQGQFLNESSTRDTWPMYLDLILMCTTKSGENHTVTETKKWLNEIGLINIEYNPLSFFNPCSYVRAFRKE